MKDVFKEKYLKYDSSITLGIFILVWNRLIELGYKSFNNLTVERRYNEFKGPFNYFMTTQDHPNEFSCYSNRISYTETTVEEILGYNPFIKETTTVKDWNNATEEDYDEQISEEPTRLSFYVKYCDEFTEDLLKYLMEWSQKNNTLKDRGRDNSFKGLKKDGYFLFDNFGLAAPKSRLYKERIGFGYGVDNNKQICLNEYSIKQVKELIGYKEHKPVDKWNVGGYVVAINNGNANGKPKDKYQIGFINKITHSFSDGTCGLEFSSNCCNKSDFKWFATKFEAEEFAKTLGEPDSTIECETCNETGEVMIGKLYPNGHTEVNEECPICGDNEIIDKPDKIKLNYLPEPD